MSLQDIQSRIHTAEEKAGRAVGSTQLIAVSKVQPNERVEVGIERGPSLLWRKPGSGSCGQMA